MPGFIKGSTGGSDQRSPFGQNQWLRSTKGVKHGSKTVAATAVTSQTIDGFATKILQPGTVLARITAATGTSLAADVGKVGPFVDDIFAVNEVQNVEVNGTGGTFTLTLESEVTAAIAVNATAAAVKTALEALPNVNVGDLGVVRTGSANDYTYAITFAAGRYSGQDAPTFTADSSSLTGGTHTATVTTATAGVAEGVGSAITDGRSDPANIVGVNDTFLPWQLAHRDVEVANAYEATAVAGNLITYDAAGAQKVASAAVVAALRAGTTANPALDVKAVAGTIPSALTT